MIILTGERRSAEPISKKDVLQAIITAVLPLILASCASGTIDFEVEAATLPQSGSTKVLPEIPYQPPSIPNHSNLDQEIHNNTSTPEGESLGVALSFYKSYPLETDQLADHISGSAFNDINQGLVFTVESTDDGSKVELKWYRENRSNMPGDKALEECKGPESPPCWLFIGNEVIPINDLPSYLKGSALSHPHQGLGAKFILVNENEVEVEWFRRIGEHHANQQEQD